MRAGRYLVAAAAWLCAGLVSLWVASETEIGPTIASLSTTHGIHSGDVVVVILGVAVASMVTLAALRAPRH